MSQHQCTPTKAQAILQHTCPRCQSGKLFKTGTFNKNFTQMHADCPVCGFHFEIEPGFFWGAMYVSYAITTAIMIIVGLSVLFIGNNPDSWVYLVCIIGSFFIAAPFTYRISRVLMLHLFSPIQFEERFANKQ